MYLGGTLLAHQASSLSRDALRALLAEGHASHTSASSSRLAWYLVGKLVALECVLVGSW